MRRLGGGRGACTGAGGRGGLRGDTVPPGGEGVPSPAARAAQAGAAALLLVVALPVLAAALGLVADGGVMLLCRLRAQGAADLAALAAAQDVDLERLARGERFIVEEQARRDARDWALGNLEPLAELMGGPPQQLAEIEVEVINPPPGGSVRHPRTGRLVSDPTVWVAVSFPVRLPLGLAALQGRAWAQADASVVEKKAGAQGS
ncbi:MAG: hypothetical protein K6T75_00050 [Acetobacteraceae bacterium]|nr:hypothetical protein [Acetobacteraceae bacterium]